MFQTLQRARHEKGCKEPPRQFEDDPTRAIERGDPVVLTASEAEQKSQKFVADLDVIGVNAPAQHPPSAAKV
jgi:hypothetical protein